MLPPPNPAPPRPAPLIDCVLRARRVLLSLRRAPLSVSQRRPCPFLLITFYLYFHLSITSCKTSSAGKLYPLPPNMDAAVGYYLDDMFLAADGQLDHHPMAKAKDARLRTECRFTNFFGRRPGASEWIAQPGRGVYFLVADRKMTSSDDITEEGYFVRPCGESRGWVIRSLQTRKLVVTRNVYVVKDANTRHAQLALSDDLVARHGSLDTAPDDYRDSVRKHFASRLDLLVSSALVIDNFLSGVPIALVPALGAGHEHVLVPETAWFTDGSGPLPVLARCRPMPRAQRRPWP